MQVVSSQLEVRIDFRSVCLGYFPHFCRCPNTQRAYYSTLASVSESFEGRLKAGNLLLRVLLLPRSSVLPPRRPRARRPTDLFLSSLRRPIRWP
jgi:hypothetical protein